jgi:parallel beta-helix repeat protein
LLSHSNTIISGNNITANTNYGISLSSSGNSSIIGNNFKNNGHGIGMDSSSSNNLIYLNNFVGNTVQAVSSPAINVWDDGYPTGGNYWSDYNGTDLHSGPSQNLNGSDGIGDTPYIIDANNTDHYPIMNPYTTSPDSNVTLNFPLGTNITSLSIKEYTSATSPYLPLPNETGPIYNVTLRTASGVPGLVRVGIHYDPGLVSNASRLVIAQFDFPVGDVNHDNRVNLQDLVLLAIAYNSVPGNPKWNPNADLNGDGKVSLQDLVLMANHYGQTGAGWIDHPTTVDTANNFVYCTTDHFSGIGIHL